MDNAPNRTTVEGTAATLAHEDESASNNPSKIVEEFPLPPAYYENFADEHYSPELPVFSGEGSDNPYDQLYDGAFAHVYKEYLPYNSDRNYKLELQK